MNIIKAKNEAAALGKYLQKKSHISGRVEWERMAFLRTFILTHKIKNEKNS